MAIKVIAQLKERHLDGSRCLSVLGLELLCEPIIMILMITWEYARPM